MNCIAIFDDLQKDGKQLECLCLKIIKQHDIPVVLHYYENIDDFLKKIFDYKYHSVFINIEVCIQHDSMIRRCLKMIPYCHLIAFGKYDLYIHALDYHAYAFLQIPFEQDKVESVMMDDLFHKPFLNIQSNTRMYRLAISEIIYIESNGMYAFIHLEKEVIRCKTKISFMLTLLQPYPFIRCHQSFVINLAYVRSLERYRAYLMYDMQVPISKTYTKYTRQEFLEFDQPSAF